MTDKIKNFFDKVDIFLDKNVSSISSVLDNDSILLQAIFNELVTLGSLRLLIPLACGGLDGDRQEWIEYNVKMAKYSGAILFLHAQHYSAIARLKKLLPNKNITDLFTHMAKDNLGLAIVFTETRQLLQINKHNNQFILTGTLPWVSGFNYFPNLLISFVAEQVVYYTIIPFHSIAVDQTLSISKPVQTMVFNATNTVSVTFDNYVVTYDKVIATEPLQEKTKFIHPAVYSIAGAAKALLEIAMHGKYSSQVQTINSHALLLEEWNLYYAQIINNETCPYQLRAKGLFLAERCAIFARVACGAAGVLSSHPLTRISRELWQYTVAGYSQQQLDEYLKHLF